MSVFAGLLKPPQDRPCIERREVVHPVPRKYTKRESPGRVLPSLPNPWGMSPMQCAILALIVQDKSHKDAGEALCISIKTVETHLTRLKEKMGVRTTLQAALEWDRWTREQP